MPAVPVGLIADAAPAEASAAVRERVRHARETQLTRYGELGPRANADLRGAAVAKFCRPDAAGRALLGRAVEKIGLSARGYDRVLKVARTIADLGRARDVASDHVAEALQYRLVE